jgi:uncharacterized protein (TIGR03437 family)
VVLNDGSVLLTGGTTEPSGLPSATAEILDAGKMEWRAAGSMNRPRINHTASLLPDGRVLIAGGQDAQGPTAETEIYDPSTGAFKRATPMSGARAAHAAVVLSDGSVMVAGGVADRLSSVVTGGVERFEPATGIWKSLASLPEPLAQHTATSLAGGRVLVAGGQGKDGVSRRIYTYDSDTDVWSVSQPMLHARRMHSALGLQDGRILFAGGAGRESSMEWYDPAGGRTTAGPDLKIEGEIQGIAATGSYEVLLLTRTSAVRVDSRSGLATAPIRLAFPRMAPALATLPDGSVLVIGGISAGRGSRTVEQFRMPDGFRAAVTAALKPVESRGGNPSPRVVVGSSLDGPLQCFANILAPPQVRAEGFTEKIGEITLTCFGGAPMEPGTAIPQADIVVTLGSSVTSRLVPPGNTDHISEALLLIDEPGSLHLTSRIPRFGPEAPVMECNTPLEGCIQYASVVGGLTVATDKPGGTVPAKNAFRGTVSANQVTFHGIPILPPVTAGEARIFRIANIRQNIAALGSVPENTPVMAAISVAHGLLTINTPVQTAGFVKASLTSTSSGGTSLSQCSTGTKVPVSTLSFTETFGTAFKQRVAPSSNTPYAGQVIQVQNISGGLYNSESGFVVETSSGQSGGMADAGSRLKAHFSNVPSGVRLFVSVNNVTDSSTPAPVPDVIGGTGASSFAQLVPGEIVPDGDGAVPGVAPTGSAPGASGSVPTAEIPVTGGSADAVWEVLNTDPSRVETLRFAVYATYTQAVPPGAATVALSYGPTAGSPTGTWIPEFTSVPNVLPLLTTTACPPTLSLLSPVNGLAGVFSPAYLTWSALGGASAYNVYLGTSNPPSMAQSVAVNSLTTGTLSAGTTYYWKVVAKTPGGDISSAVWSFTTDRPVPPEPITASASTVRFVYERGAAVPPAQNVSIQSNRPTPISMYGPASNWLRASLSQGGTPSSLVLSVAPGVLEAGFYSDVVSISCPGNTVEITVSLLVQDPPQLRASHPAFTFEFHAGAASPSSIRGTVSSTARTVAVTASGSAAWISVTPASFTTPSDFSVAVRPEGLQPGTYEGSVVLTSKDAANSPVSLPVRLSVVGPPAPAAPQFDANGILSAATFQPGPAAPGSLITIRGANLASTTKEALATPLPEELGGTSVTINGIPARLLYVSPAQINAQVPFEAAIGAAPVVVTAGGIASAPASLSIAASAPSIFRGPDGWAAAINQDGSANASNTPCGLRAILSVYLTGQGAVENQPASGAPAASDPLSQTLLPVEAVIGGLPAQIVYAGLAPGFVGLSQVNLRVPDLPPGDYPITFKIGSASSNPAVISLR